VTALLKARSEGDERAFDALVPLMDGELRRLARLYMMRERHGLALQPTALINEAYLRLVDIQRVTWQAGRSPVRRRKIASATPAATTPMRRTCRHLPAANRV
jgi:hypothetical protein